MPWARYCFYLCYVSLVSVLDLDYHPLIMESRGSSDGYYDIVAHVVQEVTSNVKYNQETKEQEDSTELNKFTHFASTG